MRTRQSCHQNRTVRYLNLGLGLSLLVQISSVTAQPGAASDAELGKLVETYCTECHNFDDFSGGLDLEGFDFSAVGEQARTGEKVVRKLSAGVMPPPGKPTWPMTDARASTAPVHRVCAIEHDNIQFLAELQRSRVRSALIFPRFFR